MDSAQKGYPQQIPMCHLYMDDGSLFTNRRMVGSKRVTEAYRSWNQNSLRPRTAAAAMGVGRKEMTRQATAEKRVCLS